MRQRWLSLAGLVGAAALLLALANCARSQKLQAITITPSSVVYGSAVPSGTAQIPVKLTAYGSYIHPPETKDVTTQVKWSVDIADVAMVDSSGNLTAGPACGIANLSASIFTSSGNPQGNVVVGFATVTVDGPASLGCPQGGATHNLSVAVTGGINGVIVSSPGGISCGTTCAAPFASGTTVVLTANPNPGHTFGIWGGCDTESGASCSVTLTSDRTVTASFN
ncbi:MAG TPA: hypothetical protein VK812_06065 [Candidatus Binatus sp.]|nr:hypothetical protein [Candidatus Binatus sp.]